MVMPKLPLLPVTQQHHHKKDWSGPISQSRDWMSFTVQQMKMSRSGEVVVAEG